MGMGCRYPASLFVTYMPDVNFRELYSRVKHLPLLPKVSDKKAKEAKLDGIHNNSFWIFLSPYEFVNADDSSNIIDVAEDNNIVFETVLFSDLCV